MLIYDQQLYDELYEATLPDGRVIHYCREFLMLGDQPYWQQQIGVLRDLRVGGQVLIVGCGFSPLLTEWRMGNAVVGTDPSPFIQTYQTQEVGVEILPYAVPSPHLYEQKWNWVITDDVVSSLGSRAYPSQETELDQFLNECQRLGRNVLHFVTPGTRGHPAITWRPFNEWVAFGRGTWVNSLTMETHHG